jgi:hypothetical protein
MFVAALIAVAEPTLTIQADKVVAPVSPTRYGLMTEGINHSNILDGSLNTYWSTDDSVTNAELVLDFGRSVTFNVVRLREYLPLGYRQKVEIKK